MGRIVEGTDYTNYMYIILYIYIYIDIYGNIWFDHTYQEHQRIMQFFHDATAPLANSESSNERSGIIWSRLHHRFTSRALLHISLNQPSSTSSVRLRSRWGLVTVGLSYSNKILSCILHWYFTWLKISLGHHGMPFDSMTHSLQSHHMWHDDDDDDDDDHDGMSNVFSFRSQNWSWLSNCDWCWDNGIEDRLAWLWICGGEGHGSRIGKICRQLAKSCNNSRQLEFGLGNRLGSTSASHLCHIGGFLSHGWYSSSKSTIFVVKLMVLGVLF